MIRLLVIEAITLLLMLCVLVLSISRRFQPDRLGLYDLLYAIFGFGAGIWVASLVI